MKTIRACMAAIAAAAVSLVGPTMPAHAGPYWNKSVKCKEADPDGRAIPTRVGNSELGWNHFSGKHNIKKCSIVNAAISGNVDKKEGNRLEYWAYAFEDGKKVKIIVIVQYSRKTDDDRYDAGRGQKIGVITAYCKGMNKCPNWIYG